MAFFTPRRRRRGTRVTFLQLVSAVAGFFLVSLMGGVLVAGLMLPAVTVAGEAADGAEKVFLSLPEEFDNTKLPEASFIYASDGTTLLATFYDQNRTVVPLEDISPWLQKAQVAIEDERFFDHEGVDGVGLIRAVAQNQLNDSKQGASTITQQLIKNIQLQKAIADDDEDAIEAATEASYERKIREWRLALAYEQRVNEEFGTNCSKDPKVDCGKEQILESYLNIAQYGTRVYGAEAAAQYYFSVPAKELNALQAATIAGITQNPSKWDPVRNPDNAKVRRNLVLKALVKQGDLTQEEYEFLKVIPVKATLKVSYPKLACAASDLAPFFCDYVTKVIKNDEAFNGHGRQLLYNGGLKIVTTLDVTAQQTATATLQAKIPAGDPSGIENALVAIEPSTGNILAMSQNRPFDPTNKEPGSTAINYAVDKLDGGSLGFSPGSSFKPVVLATWLSSGKGLNTVVSGERRKWAINSFPASCEGVGGGSGTWDPQNVESSENRQTTVKDATAYSINTAYAAMTHALDLCAIRDMALALGFERADGLEYQAVPAATLGANNASPLTMASVYQTFANRGVHCEPRAILSITDLEGNPAVDPETGETVEPPPVSCAQVITQEVADGVTYALQGVLEYGTARKHGIGRPAAGKTGTAQRNTHLWFVGYTPQLVAAVWTGNADFDQPLQKGVTINGVSKRTWYAGDLSAPTWSAFMSAMMANVPVTGFAAPSANIINGVPAEVPDLTGLAPADAELAINTAGFTYEAGAQPIFRNDVPVGTVGGQDPAPGTMLPSGQKVTYYIATDQYPSWWTKWPSGWDPLTPPSDWWGGAWPPSSWLPNNPSVGWDPTPKTPTPPDPGGAGGAGNKPGGN